jgi:hypothetical protein
MKTPFANPLHASDGTFPHLHLVQLPPAIGLSESRSLRISRWRRRRTITQGRAALAELAVCSWAVEGSHVPADAGVTHRQRPSLRLCRSPGRCCARAGRDWAGLGLRIGHKQPWRERDGGDDSGNEDTQPGSYGWRADQYLSACGFRRIRDHARRLERPPLRILCIAIRPRRRSRINIVCACITAFDEPRWRDIEVESEYVVRVVLILDSLEAGVDCG